MSEHTCSCLDRPNVGTVDDVADLTRLSRRTVIRLAQSGELPSVRLGKLYRFNLDTIVALFAGAVPDKD